MFCLSPIYPCDECDRAALSWCRSDKIEEILGSRFEQPANETVVENTRSIDKRHTIT